MARAEEVRGRDVAPWPSKALKRTPRSSLLVPMSAVMGAESSIGRLGQLKTPTLTSPSTMRARQTAYWPPRRKPLVPSMGSRAHIRPLSPPALLPASMAVSMASMSGIAPPNSFSDAGSLTLFSFTRVKICSARPVFERRELASSSPTISSCGKL